MKLRKAILFFLLAGLLLSAAGCGQEPQPTTAPATIPITQATTVPTQPPLSPTEKYARACEEVNAAGNLILSYTIEEIRRTGENTYTEKVTGKASLSHVGQKDMTAIVENIFEDGQWAILEWKDPLGLRGCGFFHVVNGKILFQRGYWDKLSFLKQHNLPIEY